MPNREEQAGGTVARGGNGVVTGALEQARRAMDRGDRAQARLLLEAVAASDPASDEARALLAQVVEAEEGGAEADDRFHHDPIRGYAPARPPRLSPGYLRDAFTAWFRTEGLLPACILATALILLLVLYLTGALGRG